MLDKAGQKGTGKWTAQVALDLGVAVPTIAAALDARVPVEPEGRARGGVAQIHRRPRARPPASPAPIARQVIADLDDALYAARICAYAQGMALIRAGADEYKWNIDLAEIGAHLEGRLHHPRAAARSSAQGVRGAARRSSNLLLDPAIARRRAVARRPAGGASIAPRGGERHPRARARARRSAYFDSYRTARLPQNLTQAQRDAFGAHTYERIDRPGAVHSEW